MNEWCAVDENYRVLYRAHMPKFASEVIDKAEVVEPAE